MTDITKTLDELCRGTVDIHTRDELKKKLASGRTLRIKLGVDPTAPDLHVGHSVVINKLRQFQEFGHQAVLIIGDFTAMVGDPSGRSKTRPVLSEDEVEQNAKTYLDQVGKILDLEKTEVVRNSEWLGKLNFMDLVKLSSQFTVAQFLERQDFANRYSAGTPISLHEFLYLLMQGYDSVAVKADVELGGTDQTFNLLVGRDLQRHFELEPQVTMTLPILPGTDGELKMSKSYNNHIGISEPAEEMFAKVMSIPDGAMEEYFTLLSSYTLDEIAERVKGEMHPRDAKMDLAHHITSRFHDADAATGARDRWSEVFSEGAIPEDIPEFELSASELGEEGLRLGHILAKTTGLAGSGSAAKGLIRDGAVKLNGEKAMDPALSVTVGMLEEGDIVLQVGKKKRFARLKLKP